MVTPSGSPGSGTPGRHIIPSPKISILRKRAVVFTPSGFFSGRLWPRVKKGWVCGCVFICQARAPALITPSLFVPQLPLPQGSPGGAPQHSIGGKFEKKREPSGFGVLNPPLPCSALLQVKNKTSREGWSRSLARFLHSGRAGKRFWSLKFPRGAEHEAGEREG